jgi:hypothetical protein
MRRFLIVAVAAASVLVMQGAAQAHWHHAHRTWHHWVRGPSYYPFYAAFGYTYAGDPFAPVCTWHRNWDAFWHRDCF